MRELIAQSDKDYLPVNRVSSKRSIIDTNDDDNRTVVNLAIRISQV